MKASRNFKIATVIPVTTIDNTLPVVLELTYSSNAAAQAANVTFAKSKYNKTYALNLQKDDGYNGDYSVIFNYLSKGKDFNGNFVGIPTYTDGCGNAVKLRASFAVFALGNDGADLHNNTNASYTSWDEYAEMLKEGYTISNHNFGGVDSTYGNRQFQIKENEKYIYQRMKERGLQYLCKTLIIPDVQEGFTMSSIYLGERTVCSAFGGNSADDQWNHINTGGQIRMDNLVAGGTILSTRYHLGDNWSDPNVYNAGVSAVNELFNHTDGNQTNMPGDYMKIVFSHGPGENQIEAQSFISFIQNTLSHPQNGDKLWIPSMDEFTDYYFTKAGVVKQQVVYGNKLTVTLNISAVDAKTRFLDMSLLTGSGLQGVAATGVDNFSFNATTGLVNVFRQKTTFQDPSLDIVPPKIVSAVIKTTAPNKLVLTYDRAVTQSLVAAYGVDNTTVTSISGSGTTWTITLANNMVQSGTQLQFYYRPQNGDAVDAQNSNLKVCAYIRGYVTFN